MKKIMHYAFAAICTLLVFTACNNDGNDPNNPRVDVNFIEGDYYGVAPVEGTRSFVMSLGTKDASFDNDGNLLSGEYIEIDINSKGAVNLLPDTGTYTVIQNVAYGPMTAIYGHKETFEGNTYNFGTFGYQLDVNKQVVTHYFNSGTVNISLKRNKYIIEAHLSSPYGDKHYYYEGNDLKFTDSSDEPGSIPVLKQKKYNR